MKPRQDISSALHAGHATRYLRGLDAHVRLLLALGVGILTTVLLPHGLLLQTRLVIGYDAAALCLLALAWTTMHFATPHGIQAGAWRQDTSRTAIFLIVLLGAVAGFAAILVMLGDVKSESAAHGEKVAHIAVSVLAVVCSWMMIHTTFALHYARRYYQDRTSRPDMADAGGLNFPGHGQPDYWDFAYYSFVIGMCSQVSDVSPGGRQMRRLTLLHSVLSFFFNTAVLALAINIVASAL